MSFRYSYPGSCHCRNVVIRLESNRTPLELGLRSDGCSFCEKHQALYTSDPAGEMHLVVRAADRVGRYRFGSETAEFLLCRDCGVLVAAYLPDAGLGVANVNALESRAAFVVNAVHVADFDGESVTARRSRRIANWTPVRSFMFVDER